jgi:hypothetical protein
MNRYKSFQVLLFPLQIPHKIDPGLAAYGGIKWHHNKNMFIAAENKIMQSVFVWTANSIWFCLFWNISDFDM